MRLPSEFAISVAVLAQAAYPRNRFLQHGDVHGFGKVSAETGVVAGLRFYWRGQPAYGNAFDRAGLADVTHEIQAVTIREADVADEQIDIFAVGKIDRPDIVMGDVGFVPEHAKQAAISAALSGWSSTTNARDTGPSMDLSLSVKKRLIFKVDEHGDGTV